MEYNVSVTPWTGTADVTSLGDSFVKVVVSTDGGETWSSTNVLHTYDNNDIPTGGGREDALLLTGYTGIVKFAFYAHSQVLTRSEEHTSELQSRENLVCRLLLEKKKSKKVRKLLALRTSANRSLGC